MGTCQTSPTAWNQHVLIGRWFILHDKHDCAEYQLLKGSQFFQITNQDHLKE